MAAHSANPASKPACTLTRDDATQQSDIESGLCSLTRAFASGFLQIRLRGRHPCLWL